MSKIQSIAAIVVSILFISFVLADDGDGFYRHRSWKPTGERQATVLTITLSAPVATDGVLNCLRQHNYPVTGVMIEPLELSLSRGRYLLGPHAKVLAADGAAIRLPIERVK